MHSKIGRTWFSTHFKRYWGACRVIRSCKSYWTCEKDIQIWWSTWSPWTRLDEFFHQTGQSLSLKQATKLSVPIYNATKNPFIIYHYYDILEETIERLNLRNRPHLIWNCDESGLPHEPKKCKVITGKGQKTLLVSFWDFIWLFFSKN